MTNSEAIGYMILAGKALEVNPKIIKQFEAEIKYQMDMKGEDQAQKAYESLSRKERVCHFLPMYCSVIFYGLSKRRVRLNR
jgi:hypothetical protein